MLLVCVSMFLAACPKKPPVSTVELPDIIKTLMERRRAFSTVEGDVKFTFPSEKVFSPAFEGHAGYEFSDRGGRARLIAAGPLGVIPIDLLVADGKYRIKLSDRPEPLDARAVERLYGRGPLFVVAETLAARPGLFFGGVPEDLSASYKVDTTDGVTRIVSVEDGVVYEIDTTRAVIVRALISREGIGELEIRFGGWEDTSFGPIPTEMVVFFGAEEVFRFGLKRYEIGRPLPERLFE